MNAKIRVTAISLALSALTWLVLLLVRPSLDPARIRPLALLIGAWLAFITAAWLLRKVPLRSAVALILLGGLAVQLAALSSPPSTSNDLYRYIWDGRVQAAGIDPYAYVPTASQLAGLRTEFLFHPGAEYCISQSYVASHPAADLTAGCTRINRPTVPTIYPPVAEAYFLAVHYLPGSDDSTTPIQSAAAGAAILTTVLLLFGLRRLGRDVRIPRGEVRRALVEVGADALLEVAVRAHHVVPPPEGHQPRVLVRAFLRLVYLLFHHAHGTRRTVRGQAAGVGQGFLHQHVAVEDPVHEADRQGFFALHDPRGKQQVQGLRHADDAGQ